jgi:hypothetical protein
MSIIVVTRHNCVLAPHSLGQAAGCRGHAGTYSFAGFRPRHHALVVGCRCVGLELWTVTYAKQNITEQKRPSSCLTVIC